MSDGSLESGQEQVLPDQEGLLFETGSGPSEPLARLPSVRFQWQLLSPPSQDIQTLAQDAGIEPLMARLLWNRGITDPDSAAAFLDPALDRLHDPFLMTDMERVVERVLRARDEREKILVYGDYDVDGITSTVVLRRALEMLGADVRYHIPMRLKDGYGLQPEVLRKAKEDGVSLAISADSGVRAFEACQAARDAGLDLIVTDHHLPDQSLPPAYAILNPRRTDCPYPEKNLAAVGVVFKLVQALFQREGRSELLHHFLKLVAIGTVADVVPITGENRIIVRHGLAGLSDPRNIGLKELLAGAGVSKEVGIFDIAFRIAPRINAVTRMGGGPEVVELFAMRSRAEARRVVEDMNRKNDLRRIEENRILQEILRRHEEDPAAFDRKFLVIHGEKWHRGVVGIVASRVAERFYRPTLVLSVDDSGCQGSGRSIPGFNLVEALDAHRDCFVRHGGHAQAVGCSMDVVATQDERLTDLAHRLDSFAADRLDDEALIPKLRIDCELAPEEISFPLCEQIAALAPHGVGNPTPVFSSKGMRVAAGPWILKQEHLKFQVQCNGHRVDALWWRNSQAADRLAASPELDLAYTVGRNVFQGETRLVLTVKDLH